MWAMVVGSCGEGHRAQNLRCSFPARARALRSQSVRQLAYPSDLVGQVLIAKKMYRPSIPQEGWDPDAAQVGAASGSRIVCMSYSVFAAALASVPSGRVAD